jgi:hypothetical protein
MNKIKMNKDGIVFAILAGATVGFCIYAFVQFSSKIGIISDMIIKLIMMK